MVKNQHAYISVSHKPHVDDFGNSAYHLSGADATTSRRALLTVSTIAAAAISIIINLFFINAACFPSYATTGNKDISINYQFLSIEIDGKAIIPKDATGKVIYPFVYADRTYLPVRALANALGCAVDWDGANNTVMIASAGGQTPSYGTVAKKGGMEAVTIEYGNITVRLDGTRLTLQNEPFLLRDSVYLPVREIADSLKFGVSFDAAKNVVGIATKAQGVAGAEPTGEDNKTDTSSTTGTNSSTTTVNNANSTNNANNSGGTADNKTGSSNKLGTTNTANAAGTGTFAASDLAIIIKNKTIRTDQDISTVVALLGAPVDYQEVESCAYDGLDKFYIFNNIEISTIPVNGDSICAIDVFDNSAATSKNITIGDSIAKIEAAYGKNYTYKDGVLVYYDGPTDNPKTPQLYFMIGDDGAVESFGIYNGKSAG